MTTPDISIPPEAAKALAMAILKITGEGIDMEEARAACRAMLRAWPHAFNEDARLLGAGAGPCLILPLPQEGQHGKV